MSIVMRVPGAGELGGVVRSLGEWQEEGGPVQLHPGDVGWFCRYGPERAAAALRTWGRGGEVLAVGLLDGADVLRMAIAPAAVGDAALARQVVADVVAPEHGVFGEGKVCVEVRAGELVPELLLERGWERDEPWAPFRGDLGGAVPDPGVRIEVAGPEQAEEWAAVVRSAFNGSTFSADRWHAMAAEPPYADARSLLARNEEGEAVAAVAVWSAGPGRPGLIEPMGVHRDQRRRGYGKAITHAAAGALRDMGSSSVTVCTPSSNTPAVAAYRAAGLTSLPADRDLCRR
ncbi:GNAT family N-acetyltransferase [Streptomyces boninensis]|uniref:GNAT family N-acetyltransferase n=1 Tax=Streptomyces boninensis TaxID=2039455 RepID=UPI003B211F0B